VGRRDRPARLDRDETIGPNKPLKDLAWGLAARGIVVARSDKMTFARGAEVGQIASFTLADEYVPSPMTSHDGSPALLTGRR
jgi:hypothetical protein